MTLWSDSSGGNLVLTLPRKRDPNKLIDFSATVRTTKQYSNRQSLNVTVTSEGNRNLFNVKHLHCSVLLPCCNSALNRLLSNRSTEREKERVIGRGSEEKRSPTLRLRTTTQTAR